MLDEVNAQCPVARALEVLGDRWALMILRDAFEFRLGSEYPEREYCVQYAESDLAFIQRLCAEVGIHFHFQHTALKYYLS